ncbi:hypothetical protein SUGI_0090390 [Cryptomeria japonica]|uniref:probably inactive leucine-rich repeat receptor-like protein kinase At3g28040 n=1 Tax=Cryptomeria japonica TaxID=3369 RepID=UPI002408E173|nr:probably inactive leucine-rich repeat receptor-like protein kinase At3g28040 [Cryptomeria japonica]GLJ08520.1 hypothetical protein SUGI_0090390 [Cryptomeria japonica]
MAFSSSLFCRLLLMLFVFILGLISGSSLVLNDDVLGLIVFKAGLQDPNKALDSWNEDDDSPCSWKYVNCDHRNGRVTQVVLEGLGLSGRIGRGLERVENLHTLSVAYNNFSESISPDIAQIGGLKNLNLSHNKLSGRIPDGFGNMERFRSLDFSNNALSGPIPDQLFGGSLKSISLSGNMLSGPIPQSLLACLYLRNLNLSANNLSGSLPASFWALRNLRVLDLSNNNFVGVVPVGIKGLYNLRELYLQNNQFSGPVPYDIGWCRQLIALDSSHNLLSGTLPESLQALNSLVFLKLQKNKLEGSIPSWIGNLTSIQHIDLSHNKFNGKLATSVGRLRSLVFLNMSNNALSGAIPRSVLQCSNLYVLDLSNNLLSGLIPQELFQLGLKHVDLSSNNLTGTIPLGSTNLYDVLEELDLSNNQLRGEIPFQISLSFNLKYLKLSANFLEAMIPPEFGDFRFIKVLDLSYNKLYGMIPGNLFDSGSLSVLKLDDNMLTGRIPAEIGNCASMYFLSLARNQLNGPIPAELTKLQHLAILNLSNNKLTGMLPTELEDLPNLLAVNVSFNRLEGRIPMKGVFQYLDMTSFEGNADLCGANLNRTCQMAMDKPLALDPNARGRNVGGFPAVVESKHRKLVLSVSAIIAISAAAVIACGVIAVTILNLRSRNQLDSTLVNLPIEAFSRSSSSEMPSGKLVMFSPSADLWTEDWINNAHCLLNKDCEIGKGGFGTVYKAVLGDGRVVAIKKLMISNLVKSQDDFEKEVHLLGKMKHPNLVGLKGYYWTPQLQLLFYDYVPNGSLYSKLHEKSHPSASLNWQTRFKIALGVARGLSHLHQACRPPLIHYNIKSSNVLLDGDCNPRISDYGLAKLLPMLDKHILSSQFQKALGYVAPEFACQSLRINEKCDVYGFGVLVLELVTGRRPVEYMEDDVLILCDHVRTLLEEGNPLSCIDPTLNDFPEEEVIPLIKLGLICTSQVPSSRPSMAEVVQILDVIKAPLESRERL